MGVYKYTLQTLLIEILLVNNGISNVQKRKFLKKKQINKNKKNYSHIFQEKYYEIFVCSVFEHQTDSKYVCIYIDSVSIIA